MKVTVLGCGSSQGVPMIGGHWGECDPANPRNRRRRPSIFVEWDSVNILVDTSPDLRAQALDAGIERIDAVLFTHAHADHVHGIDDLRGIWRGTGKDIDVYAEPEVLERDRRPVSLPVPRNGRARTQLSAVSEALRHRRADHDARN